MDRKDKIKSFVNDQAMSKAVHGVLLRTFLKKSSNKDVPYMAARWLAKELLDEAWQELERLSVDSQFDKKELTNIGV